MAGASSTNGTKVQLFTCNGTTAQQGTLGSDGTIRSPGKCLDAAEAGTAIGTSAVAGAARLPGERAGRDIGPAREPAVNTS